MHFDQKSPSPADNSTLYWCSWTSFQMLMAAVFALCIWLRFEPGFQEWVQILELQIIYIGPYVLIGTSVIALIVSFLGCLSALQENTFTLFIVSTSHIFRGEDVYFITSIWRRFHIAHVSRAATPLKASRTRRLFQFSTPDANKSVLALSCDAFGRLIASKRRFLRETMQNFRKVAMDLIYVNNVRNDLENSKTGIQHWHRSVVCLQNNSTLFFRL